MTTHRLHPPLRRAAALALVIGLLLTSGAAPSFALDAASERVAVGSGDPALSAPGVLAAESYDKIHVEEDQGWTSRYMFGMTKGIARSTLEPALKPAVWLFTIPLDIAFLPFAAIGGFFR